MTIDIDRVADYVLARLPRMSGGLRFDGAQFDIVFRELDTDLRRDSFSFVILAPLVGLKLGSAPIQLGPDIEIDKMTDDEIVRCLSLGILPDPFGSRPMVNIQSPAAVRVRFQLKKEVGREPPRPLEEAVRVERLAIQRAMMVLYALRIFKEGRVSIPALLRFSPDWPVQGSTGLEHSNPGPRPWSNDYTISPRETEFSEFWRRFEEVTAKGALANAVRRFSYASDRDRDDDRLVDLMMAAESIFLADTASPQDRGELRYRLALRAAFFIESREYLRREIFKHMKRAYDVRSTIVHGGGEPDDPKLLKSPKDAPLSLQDFTKLTEHLLRLALKKRIEMVKTVGPAPVNWEDLIIP
jgi:hypothetical protein